jgi:hypothetical protein
MARPRRRAMKEVVVLRADGPLEPDDTVGS